MQAVQEVTEDRLVAIDGKTLRGSYNKRDGKAAIHMVSAWATENKLSLGQVVVDEKPNEITAIPELLGLLDIAGAVVTIDAMGCQKEIAGLIRDGAGDYVLAVKPNQPTLYEQVGTAVDEGLEQDAECIDDASHRGAWARSRGGPHVCGLPGPGDGGSGGPVAGPQRGGGDVLGADRCAGTYELGGSLLHPESAPAGPGVRRCGPRPLGYRE
jgi:predicted transposase YbfD/YdcC